MSPFAEFAKDLRELLQSPSQTSFQDARRTYNRICADAVRRYKFLAQAGVPGFNIELIFNPYLPNGGTASTFEFNGDNAHDAAPWKNIAEDVAKSHPEISPNPCLVIVEREWSTFAELSFNSTRTYRPPAKDEKLGRTTKFDLKNWRDFVWNYAICMDVLAELDPECPPAQTEIRNPASKPMSLTTWTSESIGMAIAEYKARRTTLYKELVALQQSGHPDRERTTRVFGRNAIAEAIGVKKGSQRLVGDSKIWLDMAAELGIELRRGRTIGGRKRIKKGLDQGLEQAATAMLKSKPSPSQSVDARLDADEDAKAQAALRGVPQQEARILWAQYTDGEITLAALESKCAKIKAGSRPAI